MEKNKLHRKLSSNQITMIAMGCAIGTGLFLGSGLAISTAGPSVLISYAARCIHCPPVDGLFGRNDCSLSNIRIIWNDC